MGARPSAGQREGTYELGPVPDRGPTTLLLGPTVAHNTRVPCVNYRSRYALRQSVVTYATLLRHSSDQAKLEEPGQAATRRRRRKKKKRRREEEERRKKKKEEERKRRRRKIRPLSGTAEWEGGGKTADRTASHVVRGRRGTEEEGRKEEERQHPRR